MIAWKILFAVVATLLAAPEGWETMTPEQKAEADPKYVLDSTMELIDGSEQALSEYEGKVLLIVNTASLCGYTPQYEQLEALYEAKKDDGLVVLGFPCNQFNGQDPGTNAEIAAFCSEKFNVTFPMFAKIDVKGEDAAPLYKRLREQAEPIGGEPQWNFTKFLVNRSGRVVARFGSKTSPDDPELVGEVDRLLAEH